MYLHTWSHTDSSLGPDPSCEKLVKFFLDFSITVLYCPDTTLQTYQSQFDIDNCKEFDRCNKKGNSIYVSNLDLIVSLSFCA